MDKSTKQFLKDLSGKVKTSHLDADVQIKIADAMAQQKKWDSSLKISQATEAAILHPSQKYRNISDHYPNMQNDLKEILPALTKDLHEEKPVFPEKSTDFEGKQELETLLEIATEKKSELDSKVNELLLSGRSDEYWDALREREGVEGVIKTYNEQLNILADQN